MNALLIALTMSMTVAEGNLDGPGSLAADLAPRMVLEPAPFPLRMSFFGTEEAPAIERLDLRSENGVTLCVAFELPSYSELLDLKNIAAPTSVGSVLSRP
jgi:hypothetical protein